MRSSASKKVPTGCALTAETPSQKSGWKQCHGLPVMSSVRNDSNRETSAGKNSTRKKHPRQSKWVPSTPFQSPRDQVQYAYLPPRKEEKNIVLAKRARLSD